MNLAPSLPNATPVPSLSTPLPLNEDTQAH
jgi:hypothetical protein